MWTPRMTEKRRPVVEWRWSGGGGGGGVVVTPLQAWPPRPHPHPAGRKNSPTHRRPQSHLVSERRVVAGT
ncbi:hypothetical protein E2C01_066766 [Portunus trituberculatus]|uniref:Uncharacterized protein n=1 Tax=Portunus trituberculatus TaxID=210409 RepID=A0A5B7HRS3_PORTR|nr:hypothetical protein [Portunus trituberculatus]